MIIHRHSQAFSLVEILVVLAIIALLMTIAAPSFAGMQERSRSVACMNNLRQIGVAVNLYAGEHNQMMPYINNPARPVYDSEDDLPGDVEALTMLQALSPYGLTEGNLKCPADVANENYFKAEGSSYEWRPILDGESKLAPKIYTRRGGIITLSKVSRVTLVTDITNVHSGRQNRLTADGSVKMY